jgi:hypothetical protein
VSYLTNVYKIIIVFLFNTTEIITYTVNVLRISTERDNQMSCLFVFIYKERVYLWIGDWAVCSHLLTLVPRSRIFLPWRWRRYVPPKSRFTQDLHGATSQKTAFFIVAAVKTSNLTKGQIWPPSSATSFTVRGYTLWPVPTQNNSGPYNPFKHFAGILGLVIGPSWGP